MKNNQRQLKSPGKLLFSHFFPRQLMLLFYVCKNVHFIFYFLLLQSPPRTLTRLCKMFIFQQKSVKVINCPIRKESRGGSNRANEGYKQIFKRLEVTWLDDHNFI